MKYDMIKYTQTTKKWEQSGRKIDESQSFK